MAITNVVGDSRHWFLVSSLTFLMALLVAQTRVEKFTQLEHDTAAEERGEHRRVDEARSGQNPLPSVNP